MRISSLAVGAGLLLVLTGCATTTPAPVPTSSASSSPTSTPTSSPTAAAETDEAEEVVTAAFVVVTASTVSVFGSDGSTLVAADYEADAAGVAAELAEALGTTPSVSTTDGSSGSCPSRTLYDFGGLVLGTPQGLGSPASVGRPGTYDVSVSASSVNGVPLETVAGQRIGATRAAFEAAIGDDALLDEHDSTASLAFDIVNPAEHPYDHIGVDAVFEGGVLAWLGAPTVVRFVGDCG